MPWCECILDSKLEPVKDNSSTYRFQMDSKTHEMIKTIEFFTIVRTYTHIISLLKCYTHHVIIKGTLASSEMTPSALVTH